MRLYTDSITRQLNIALFRVSWQYGKALGAARLKQCSANIARGMRQNWRAVGGVKRIAEMRDFGNKRSLNDLAIKVILKQRTASR